MAGRRSCMSAAMETQSQSRLLASVRGFVRSLVEDICNCRSPSVALDRYRTFCSDPFGNCACSFDTPFAKEFISIGRQPQAAHRLAVLLRVLSIIQLLLQQNKHASKRDIFYMDPALFVDQAVVDHIINDICVLLRCSRHHLNVVPVGKGLVMGWLRFKESDRTISCIKNPNTEHPIPVCLEDVEDMVSVAQYILVVEKETVFQRLANDKFCDRNRCIVITGRGYPDVPTRRFLRHLVEHLRLPVYGLVDSDPYGFDILTTYRFGSMQMAYDAKLMRVPEMRWLGVLPSDFEEFNLPDRCLLNLTPEGGNIFCTSSGLTCHYWAFLLFINKGSSQRSLKLAAFQLEWTLIRVKRNHFKPTIHLNFKKWFLICSIAKKMPIMNSTTDWAHGKYKVITLSLVQLSVC